MSLFESLPGLGTGITVASFQHSEISPEAHISLNISSKVSLLVDG